MFRFGQTQHDDENSPQRTSRLQNDPRPLFSALCGFIVLVFIIVVASASVAQNVSQSSRTLLESSSSGDEDRLRTAIYTTDLEGIAKVIGDNPKLLDERGPDGLRPIHCAVLSRNRVSAQCLLDLGARVDVFVLLGIGDEKRSVDLLKRHPKLALQSLGRISALHWAVRGGNPKLVELLIAQGAHVDQKNPFGGRTALHDAAARLNSELVRVLLAAGADVNAVDSDGITPLHLASKEANSDVVVEALINAGASVGAKNKSGVTPLELAAAYGRKSVVQRYLQNNSLDESSKSRALIMAAAEGHSEIMSLLLKYGVVAAYRDEHGLTALHAASSRGQIECIKVALDAGIDINCQDMRGDTALHYALFADQQQAANLLIARGADPTLPNRDGVTAAAVIKKACEKP